MTGGVCEADVDEQRGRGEEVGVDLGDGAGEVVLLERGEGDYMLDFVKGHRGRVVVERRRWGEVGVD